MRCNQKIAYIDEPQAKRACKKSHKQYAKKMYFYKYTVCGNYHLSKTDSYTFYVRKTIEQGRY